MKKLSIFLALALLFTAGAVYAQDLSDISDLPDPGILPGHPLYFTKSIGETLGGIFVIGDKAQINRSLSLSERRLAEARALADGDDSDRAQRAVERYENEIGDIEERVNRVKAEGQEVDEGLQAAMETVASATLKHQSVLAEVYEKVPEQAKAAISRAMEAGMAGHENALSAIPEEARVQAEERLSEVKNQVNQRLNQLRDRGIPIPQIPVFEEGGIPSGPGNAGGPPA
ncbi:MAG: DUF5667 domain-containing protein, partial [Candidatus Paceibacterota bacterium]